jgi:hypothetical protein
VHGGQAEAVEDGDHVPRVPAHRGRTADACAVTAAAQVGRDQAEAGIGRPQPVPLPALAADAVDGEDRFGARHERLDGEPAAGHLHGDDLAPRRVL